MRNTCMRPEWPFAGLIQSQQMLPNETLITMNNIRLHKFDINKSTNDGMEQ